MLLLYRRGNQGLLSSCHINMDLEWEDLGHNSNPAIHNLFDHRQVFLVYLNLNFLPVRREAYIKLRHLVWEGNKMTRMWTSLICSSAYIRDLCVYFIPGCKSLFLEPLRNQPILSDPPKSLVPLPTEKSFNHSHHFSYLLVLISKPAGSHFTLDTNINFL